MPDKHEYAERLFPEPVDLGIAQPDRAVSSVAHGTRSHLEGEGGEGTVWYEGTGTASDQAVQNITIYPPTRGISTQGDAFEPVKIGVLIDMDLNQLLADWIDPTILAIEDALNEGVWARSPVQLVIADARGLPRENYRKVIDGYRWLVDQGCVVVLGPMISDNSLVLQDTANELGVSCLGWTGARRFASDYCFTVANGDVPTEGVICANWLYQQGIRKVGLFWEAGSSGRDYADFFRDEAIRLGMTVTREVKLEPNPRDLETHLAAMREAGTEGLYYGGYGYACFHFGAALQALRMGSAPHHGDRLHVLFEQERVGLRESKAGTASTSSVRTVPIRTTTPWCNASPSGSVARRATSWSPWPTTRLGWRSTASPTPTSPNRAGSKTGSSGSVGCPPPTAVPRPTSSSAPGTTRATRVTSSPSAS